MKTLNIIIILGLVMSFCAAAQAAETPRVATITEIKGKVEMQTGEGPWMPAQIGMILNQGDTIRTMDESYAILNVDGTAETASVEVKQKSNLKLAMLIQDKEAATQNTLLDLAIGEVLIKARKLHSDKSKFEVKTPTSIVGVRGTTFSVTVEAVE